MSVRTNCAEDEGDNPRLDGSVVVSRPKVAYEQRTKVGAPSAEEVLLAKRKIMLTTWR